MTEERKYLKTFKYSTIGAEDYNIEQLDEQPIEPNGEDLKEHADITGFAQFAVEDFLRSFPDESPSKGARELEQFENLKQENSNGKNSNIDRKKNNFNR